MAYSGGKEIVLITDKRIAYLKSNDLFGGWQVKSNGQHLRIEHRDGAFNQASFESTP